MFSIEVRRQQSHTSRKRDCTHQSLAMGNRANMGYSHNASLASAPSNSRRQFLPWVLILGYALLTYSTCMAAEISKSPALPATCSERCATPHGEVLGRSPRGVVAFSNCNSECVLPEGNTIDGTSTGLKWQCVEYARRWLLLNRGAVFSDVNIAADIWTEIDQLTRVSDKAAVPLVAHLNGSRQPPMVGDLLIYAKAFYDTGHVAVVLDVDPTRKLIMVGEQNFDNQSWDGRHARRIGYIEKDERVWVLDPYIIGWKQIAK